MAEIDISTQDIRVMQKFIDTLVGIPRFSYPAKKNGPRNKMTSEFAHVDLLEEYQIGIPSYLESQPVDGVITRTIISPARLRFRIGLINTKGINSVKIMHGWTTEPVKQLMIDTGYGFCQCYPISREDAKLEKQWEARQGFAIDMYVTRTFTETYDQLTGVTITGEYSEGEFLHQIEIDVNNN